MKRAAVSLAALIAVLCVASPPAALALTLVDTSGAAVGGKMQSWVDAAKAPLPPSVVLHSDECPVGGGACAGVTGPADVYGVTDRYALMHEIGHVFDMEVMTDAARHAVLRAIGAPGRPWYTGYVPGAEMAADAYAWCAILGTRWRDLRVLAYYRPGPKRHRRACHVFRQAAAGVFGVADQTVTTSSS